MENKPKKKLFRFFVSSPSDVAEERHIVESILSELRDRYGTWVTIEPFLWEKQPLMANVGDFQSQIAPVEEMHLVIAILWTRIGFELSDGKIDGLDPKFCPPTWNARNPTGTEVEIARTLQAFANSSEIDISNRYPDLLVYKKVGNEPKVSLQEAEYAAKQYSETNTFFHWLTKDNTNGSFTAAFHQFETPVQFENLLKEHLSRWIEQRLGLLHEEGKIHLTWPHGSPFRALQPFDVEHSPIFFGRQRETFDILERLSELEKDENKPTFLMVLGKSGSGKSSLIRAGVISKILARRGENWKYSILFPGIEGNPINSLIHALCEKDVLSNLPSPQTLINISQNDSIPLCSLVTELLEKENLRLFLLIDQFEELFNNTIDVSVKDLFAAILISLAKSKRVWIVSTMRSDFYHMLEMLPNLLSSIEGDGIYHLQIPNYSAIDLIVKNPAQAAGLRYEEKNGITLDQTIIEDAMGLGDCLPLLEFTLHRLYEIGHDDGILSYEEYDSIGKIGGAINKHAIEVIASMDIDARNSLPDIFDELIGLDSDGNPIRLYPHVRIFGKETPASRMVEMLVKERLLVASFDQNKEATISLAHDLLLYHWNLIQEHIRQNIEMMKQRHWLRESAKRWETENYTSSLLLDSDKLIDRAEIQYVYTDGKLSELENKLIEASIRYRVRKRKSILVTVALLDIASLVSFLACIIVLFMPKGVEQNSFLKLFVSYDPVYSIIGTIPQLLFLTWITLRILKPTITILALKAEIKLAISVVCIEFVSILIQVFHPETLNGYENYYYVTSPMVFSVFFIWAGNAIIKRKKIRNWKNKRFPIRYLDLVRIYIRPIMGLSAIILFFLFFIFIGQKAIDMETSEQAQDNLKTTILDPINYNSSSILAMVENGANVNTKSDNLGYSAIALASYNLDYLTVESLCKDYKADVNIEDKEGNTPIFFAILGNTTLKRNKTISVLINCGADINHKTKEGITPLFYASQIEQPEIVDTLIRLGANVNEITFSGVFPSYIAASEGNKKSLAIIWKCSDQEVENLLNMKMKETEHLSFEKICCVAGWQRWKGNLTDSRILYEKALKLAKIELDTSKNRTSFVLSEWANSFFLDEFNSSEGIHLLEEATNFNPTQHMSMKLEVALIFRYELAGRFDDALSLANKLTNKTNDSIPSPLWLNYAHALMFHGDSLEAKYIYTKFRNTSFSDGKRWNNEVISDWNLLEWQGIGIEKISKAKKSWGLKTNDVSFLQKPTLINEQKLLQIKRNLIGTWRRDKLKDGTISIVEWQILSNGKARYYEYDINGILKETSVTEWKIGYDKGSTILGELKNKDGSITLCNIDFRANRTELICTPQNSTSMEQCLYRKIAIN